MTCSIEVDAERAYRVLAAGGVVLLPTDVGYGLVGSSAQSVSRIFALKGRPANKPCITVANARIAEDVASFDIPGIRTWMAEVSARFPVAFVTRMRPASVLLKNAPAEVIAQATTNGTIATFHNAGVLVTCVAEMAQRDGRLVVGSSANLSSTGNHYRLEDVPASIRLGVDLEIDHGPARYRNERKLATTLLDLTTLEFRRLGIHSELIAESWVAFQRRLIQGAVVSSVAPVSP